MSTEEKDKRAKPVKGKKPAPGKTPIDGKKRRSTRAVSKPVQTTMKLGRTLRTGGSYVLRVSKKAYNDFNEFTQSGDVKASARGAKSRRPISRNLAYLIFLLTIFVVLSVSLMALNNSSVSVDKRTVSVIGLPEDLEGYTILFVSDLHARSFGTGQTALLRTVNSLSYNLALFGGDMVGRSGDAQPFYDLLEGMTANRPAYFIAGDSDPGPLVSAARGENAPLPNLVLADWILGAQSRGATYLSATTGVNVGNATIWLSPASCLGIDIQETLTAFESQEAAETDGVLYGVGADGEKLPFTSYRRIQMSKLNDAVRQMNDDDLQITLAHIPPLRDFIETTQRKARAAVGTYAYLPASDLILSGHYCGGGWKLPFYGALYVPNTLLPRHGWFPARDEVEGFKQIGGTIQYTSTGLSVTDRIYLPNFRLFNNPTVTLLTLTSAITDDLLGE